MTISAPGFYGPQGRVVRMKPVIDNVIEKSRTYSYDGWRVTNFEMEGAAIAGMSKHLGHEAITVCLVVAHRYLKNANTEYKVGIPDLISLVLDTISKI